MALQQRQQRLYSMVHVLVTRSFCALLCGCPGSAPQVLPDDYHLPARPRYLPTVRYPLPMWRHRRLTGPLDFTLVFDIEHFVCNKPFTLTLMFDSEHVTGGQSLRAVRAFRAGG